MVSISTETNGIVDHSELIEVWSFLILITNGMEKNMNGQLFLTPKQTFLKSSTCPEIHGHLHVKEQSKKPWKKFYFVLRRSGLYFSTKGTSKVSKIHIQ